MKIINPTPCTTDFGVLQFERREDPYREDVFAVMAAGEQVAELMPLTLPGGGVLQIDSCTEAMADPAGAWSLSLIGSDSRQAGTHILFVSSDWQAQHAQLTGELAVWATLSVMWAHNGTVVGCG